MNPDRRSTPHSPRNLDQKPLSSEQIPKRVGAARAAGARHVDSSRTTPPHVRPRNVKELPHRVPAPAPHARARFAPTPSVGGPVAEADSKQDALGNDEDMVSEGQGARPHEIKVAAKKGTAKKKKLKGKGSSRMTLNDELRVLLQQG